MPVVIGEGHHAVDGDNAFRPRYFPGLLNSFLHCELVGFKIIPAVVMRGIACQSDAGDSPHSAASGYVPGKVRPGNGNPHPSLDHRIQGLVFPYLQYRKLAQRALSSSK